jgi:hypothetical protein
MYFNPSQKYLKFLGAFSRQLSAFSFRRKPASIPDLVSRRVKQGHTGVPIGLRSEVDAFARAAIALGEDKRTGVKPSVDGTAFPNAVNYRN